MPAAPRDQSWIHGYAVAWAAAIFGLVALGGVVTTKGAGLAVPDWPTTFGHNMFLVPLEKWITRAPVFWEHAHRLAGSLVGLLTIGLAAALWPRRPARPWLRSAGLILLALVIAQGVMGGLRVTELSVTLALLHGVTAQLLLGAAVATAVALRPPGAAPDPAPAPAARRLSLLLLAALLLQLILGAWVRHHGAATAIPDFPTAFGGLVPPTSAEALSRAAEAAGMAETPALTAVWMHFAHRLGALLVVGLGAAAVAAAGLSRPNPAAAVGLTLAAQVLLGPVVVITDRTELAATLHHVGGAAALAAAAWLAARLHLRPTTLWRAAQTPA